jgi:hypothetical protein
MDAQSAHSVPCAVADRVAKEVKPCGRPKPRRKWRVLIWLMLLSLTTALCSCVERRHKQNGEWQLEKHQGSVH